MNVVTSKPVYQESSVSSEVSDFLKLLTPIEKSVLKSKLSSQIPFFFNKENQLFFSENYSSEKFDQIASLLYEIAHPLKTSPDNGIVYRGKPAWVTDDLLRKLQDEAVKRRDQPLDRVDHFLGCGGKYADAISTDSEVLSFVAEHAGLVKPTGIASYLYYDSPGLGIRPHVDTDVFSINLMLMLKHEPPSNQAPSTTLVFPARKAPERYHLQVGEVMLMFGGSVIHARSIIGQDENIHLLTIGFKS